MRYRKEQTADVAVSGGHGGAHSARSRAQHLMFPTWRSGLMCWECVTSSSRRWLKPVSDSPDAVRSPPSKVSPSPCSGDLPTVMRKMLLNRMNDLPEKIYGR